MTGKSYHYSGILILAAAFGLAACEGDTGPQGPAGHDGLGYAPMPDATTTLTTYDSGADPADPADDPPNQGTQEQITDGSGVWDIPLDGQVQLNRAGDGTVSIEGVRYDSDHDDLWITIDGIDYSLTDRDNFAANSLFDSSNSQEPCCHYGVPAPYFQVSWYGALSGNYVELAGMGVQDDPSVDIRAYALYGVKTASTDVPTGTADYSGSSEYYVDYNGTLVFMTGAPTITADFDAGTVAYSDSASGAVATMDLTASADIDGNTYSGVVHDSTYDNDGDLIGTTDDQLQLQETGSQFLGAFYGPSAAETGGVLSAADTDATADAGGGTSTGGVVGGFVAAQP